MKKGSCGAEPTARPVRRVRIEAHDFKALNRLERHIPNKTTSNLLVRPRHDDAGTFKHKG